MPDVIVDNTTPEVMANSQDLLAGDTIEYNSTFVTVQTPPASGSAGTGVDRENGMTAVSIPYGLSVRRVSVTSTFVDYVVPVAPAEVTPDVAPVSALASA